MRILEGTVVTLAVTTALFMALWGSAVRQGLRDVARLEREVRTYRDAVGTLNLLLTEAQLTSLPICERPNEFPQSVKWNVWRSSDGPEPDWTRVTSWDAEFIGAERER